MLAVKRPIAIVPGAMDMSLDPRSDPRDVVHLTVALPHVHEGTGEPFVDALLLSAYLDVGQCPATCGGAFPAGAP